MVNLTRFLMMPRRTLKYSGHRGVDPYWRKRQVLLLTSHFYGRGRNCFSIAIRRLQKSLQYVRVGRALRKRNAVLTWEQRIDAGCKELGHMPEGSRTMLEAMARTNILLNKQSLSNLAVWEPRTFECLNKIAAVKAREDRLARKLGPFPRGILGRLFKL